MCSTYQGDTEHSVYRDKSGLHLGNSIIHPPQNQYLTGVFRCVHVLKDKSRQDAQTPLCGTKCILQLAKFKNEPSLFLQNKICGSFIHDRVAIPGDSLCQADRFTLPSVGTYIRDATCFYPALHGVERTSGTTGRPKHKYYASLK